MRNDVQRAQITMDRMEKVLKALDAAVSALNAVIEGIEDCREEAFQVKAKARLDRTEAIAREETAP